MQDKMVVYGWCTRNDGTRVPVYFFYEIEEGKAQIHLATTDEWIDIVEPYKTLASGRPNKPHKIPLEVTEVAPKIKRS